MLAEGLYRTDRFAVAFPDDRWATVFHVEVAYLDEFRFLLMRAQLRLRWAGEADVFAFGHSTAAILWELRDLRDLWRATIRERLRER